MAMIAISCSDDSIVETDDGDGELNPNTKVVITAEMDGSVVSTNTFELKDDSYIPSSSSTGGSYQEITSLFLFNVSNSEGTTPIFSLLFSAMLQDFEVGTYSYSTGDTDFINGSYMNKEISDNSYIATSVEFVITDMKYLGIGSYGTYYTSGSMTMVAANGEETITVKATIENAPITYSGNVSAKK